MHDAAQSRAEEPAAGVGVDAYGCVDWFDFAARAPREERHVRRP